MQISLKSIVICVIGAVVLSGCGSELNLKDYTKAPLRISSNAPSVSEIKNAKPRIVLVAVDSNGMLTASQANIGRTIATRINTELSQAKSVKIVKRVNKTSSDTYNQILMKEMFSIYEINIIKNKPWNIAKNNKRIEQYIEFLKGKIGKHRKQN